MNYNSHIRNSNIDVAQRIEINCYSRSLFAIVESFELQTDTHKLLTTYVTIVSRKNNFLKKPRVLIKQRDYCNRPAL